MREIKGERTRLEGQTPPSPGWDLVFLGSSETREGDVDGVRSPDEVLTERRGQGGARGERREREEKTYKDIVSCGTCQRPEEKEVSCMFCERDYWAVAFR
jgi:hypothetical protein